MKPQHHGPSNPKRLRKVLLLYIAGTVLLTNVLTIVFVHVFERDERSSSVASAASAPSNAASAPENTMSAPEPPGESPGTSAARRLPLQAGEAPAQVPEAPEQVPEPPAVARFLVDSSPAGATVHAGGRSHGVTPLTIEVPADDPGRIRLSMEGYRSRSVALTAKRPHIEVRLVPLPEPAAATRSTRAAAGDRDRSRSRAAGGGRTVRRAPDVSTSRASGEASPPPAGQQPDRKGDQETPSDSLLPRSDNPDPWADPEPEEEQRPGTALDNPDPWAE